MVSFGEAFGDLDDLLQLAEGTANMLRGMTLDPAIPEHAKSAMRVKIAELEDAVQKGLA